MGMEQEPGDGNSLESMSPQELARYDQKQKAMAALMGPFMMEGIEWAAEDANDANITEPKLRYAVLAASTRRTLDDRSLRRGYILSYSRYGSAFDSEEDYYRVFEQRFPNLMRAAVEDAAWVGLGGYNFLKSVNRSSEALQIIPRSLGLLAVTGTHGHRNELRAELGDPINVPNFMFHRHLNEDELVFTPSAREIINRYPSPLQGCPARAIHIEYENAEGFATTMPDPRNNNLLTLYWGNVSKFAFEKIA